MLRVVSIIPDDALNQEFAGAIRQVPDIELVRALTAIPPLEDLLRSVRIRRPDCLFVYAQDVSRVEALITEMDALMLGIPVIGVGCQIEPHQLLKLMHLGIREYLTSPITPTKLVEAADFVRRHLKKHAAPMVHSGDLYTFLPAKPGVGTSTIALSTACALADELSVRTLLLDCDLSAGAVRFLLKLGNSSSILDAMAHAESLDEDLWSQLVGKWKTLEVLHAGQLDPPPGIDVRSMHQVLSVARTQYEVIFADLASSVDLFSVEWLRESRRIFLVTTPEVVPLHLAQNRLRNLTELGLGDRVSLILNRKDHRRGHLEDSEVVRILETPVAYSIANDYDHVQKAILGGFPLPHNSDIGQGILTLAQSLVAETQTAGTPPSHPRRFLEFFHVPHIQDMDSTWHD